MFSTLRRILPRLTPALAPLLLITFGLRAVSPCLIAEETAGNGTVLSADRQVLTSFEQIWDLTEAEKHEWHRVRMDVDVYFYDPTWKSLWGRCGQVDNYVSFVLKTPLIKSGQRIRIEGRLQPSAGMLIEEPSVTILAESIPLDVLSTTGEVANTARFDTRMVTVEGYVDRQLVRDASHVDLQLAAEGRLVTAQLLLHADAPMPQLQGSLVRAKGVYLARGAPDGGVPKIEVWIQRAEDIEVLGTLERDERFESPAVERTTFSSLPADKLVRVEGVVQAQRFGQTLTIRQSGGEIVLQTSETLSVQPGDEVEAIGYPAQEGKVLVLRQGLYRLIRHVFTTVGQLWQLPEAEQQKWQRARIEFIVYHYDPKWKALWGSSNGVDNYLSLGTTPFPIKAGQKILIDGMVCPNKGPLFDNPKITVLEDSVPLPAASIKGQISKTDRFNKSMVVMEGYVDRQALMDPDHLELDLVVEGRPVTGRVMLDASAALPNWEGAFVRVTGVYSATLDPTGGRPTIEIWVSGIQRIETLGWLEKDPRFNLPLTPIEKIAEAGAGKTIRVEGVALTQQPGRLITIRDETGQTTLATAQLRVVKLGERIEAIGSAVFDGSEWSLGESLYRPSKSVRAATPAGLPKLRVADQLRELQPEEAARSYPVQLSGVITWARPNADFFFIRDASGGVCVFRPADFTGSLYLGTKVEVIGVSAPGKFTPVVLAGSVKALASVELPEPRRVTLEQALTGIEEAQWVSMSGYVRAVETDGLWTRLDLTTSGGEFQVMMPKTDRWDKLPGSVIRVKGVCSARANSKRQLTGIQVWVPTSRFLEIEEAAPDDPFSSVVTRPIASLRQFSSLEALNRRVRVAGVVVNQEAGRRVNIQEGTEGLLVLSRDTVHLTPGDRIEAVGFPGRENSRLVLREAVYRKVSSGDEPAPLLIANLNPIDAERDGLLARVEGTLVDIGAQEKGTRLILQNNDLFFEAVIDRSKAEVSEVWVPGSRLELTGVYEIEFDEYRRPHAVRLQLRNLSDVRVLRRPSALTAKRVQAVASVLAVCVVLGCGWVLALRRRVRQQTGVIRDQLEKEKAARLDAALARASKLESVGVLAGGIAHDFNNLLTVVIGNLSLAKMDEKIDAETVHCLVESEKAAARAKDLTQQLLTFSKGGEPVRTSAQLPEIIREATQFGLHGSNVCSEFDIAPDLWPAEVDKGQIGQVVHNLIINASQAMPGGGLIRIVLRNEDVCATSRPRVDPGRYVRLSISDTGVGIEEEHLTRIFEPYFTTKSQGSGLGLATVYSIVKKHQGHIDVESTVGQGTTFNVWLPAATQAPTEPVLTTAAPVKAGRVLIMDDEVSIRKLGSAVIKRMGLEVTAVNDGAAVVSEYAAASAAGTPYDLVILDLTVPGGMGGAEAMQQLRTMDGDVRAIVSSGYSSDPVMANHVVHGFCARVPKPYTAEELIEVVSSVMKTTRAGV